MYRKPRFDLFDPLTVHAVKDFRFDEDLKVDQQAVTAEAALADERLHLCERK
jgi:hypothetical protein